MKRRREAPPSGYTRGFDPGVTDEVIDLLAGDAPSETRIVAEPVEVEQETDAPAGTADQVAIESFESEVVPGITTLAPIKFDVTKSQLTELVSKIGDVTFDTPANYERGRLAIANLRSLRVGVEKVARSLKDGANDYKKQVDKHGNELIAIISEPEDRLCAAKKIVDDEKARLKAEKEAAEKAAIEAELRAKREEEERILREAREAEARKLAEERAAFEAEKQRLAEQQRQADKAAAAEKERVAAEQRAEQARLDAERAEIEAEKARAVEAKRIADEAAQAERDAADARAREERERVETAARAEREAADKRAREAREAEEAKLRADREALEAEKIALREAKEKAEREQFEREATAKAEAEAVAKVERERVAAEAARVAEAERLEAERARLEALKPDRERLRDFARQIWSLGSTPPATETKEAGLVAVTVCDHLLRLAAELESFGATASSDKAAE